MLFSLVAALLGNVILKIRSPSSYILKFRSNLILKAALSDIIMFLFLSVLKKIKEIVNRWYCYRLHGNTKPVGTVILTSRK